VGVHGSKRAPQALKCRANHKLIWMLLLAYSAAGRLLTELLGRGHNTCPVRSIAASEVEGLVLGQVRRLLASPELVARTITAVQRENGAAEDPLVDESEVINAIGALEPVWDELYLPSRRASCGC
jgi:hypothetical protein